MIMKDRIELAKYFTECGFKVGAEIGVLEGSYARALCRYNPELTLYCIDAWGLLDNRKTMELFHLKCYERAKNKLAPHNANLIREPSSTAVERFEDVSLDFVYIDANHSYACVLEDITIWTPKVRSGGIVSGHDYQLPEVRKAVDEYVGNNNLQLRLTDYDKLNTKTNQIERSWYFTKT